MLKISQSYNNIYINMHKYIHMISICYKIYFSLFCSGCSLIRPCKMPDVDMCIYDLGDACIEKNKRNSMDFNQHFMDFR